MYTRTSLQNMLNHSEIKNSTEIFLCLPHSENHKAQTLSDCWKNSACKKVHFILFDFIIFSSFLLSLLFLSHQLCDKVLIYLFIFISDSLPFLYCLLDTVIPQKTKQQQYGEKKLFTLKGNWHWTNKSLSVHTSATPPSPSHPPPFFQFKWQAFFFFFEIKADIIFPARPKCLWNLSCCCALITCTLLTSW